MITLGAVAEDRLVGHIDIAGCMSVPNQSHKQQAEKTYKSSGHGPKDASGEKVVVIVLELSRSVYASKNICPSKP